MRGGMTNNTDKQRATMTLEKGLAAFLDAMLGKNRSAATLRAYRTDVLQFLAFLTEQRTMLPSPRWEMLGRSMSWNTWQHLPERGSQVSPEPARYQRSGNTPVSWKG